MKKIKKILILCLVAIIILIVATRIYYYSILSKISKTTMDFVSSSEPYFIKITRNDVFIGDGQIIIDEYYRNNNASVHKCSTSDGENNILEITSWEFLNEEFCNSYIANYENENGLKELTCITRNKERLMEEEFNNTKGIIYDLYTLGKIEFETDNIFTKLKNEIKYRFFYPIVVTEEYNGKKCYAIDPFGSGYKKIYVDKESLLTVAAQYKDKDKKIASIIEYEYLKQAPDGVFEKPDPEDFDVVNFSDEAFGEIYHRKLIAENPITGTDLKPGEQLIENVEIAQGEELNFLKLTPNESGIIKFGIDYLDTYNKFRENYSGLRELTEKDFESYFVVIAYKTGEKLNYLQQYASNEAWRWNFVVDGEKNNRESLLLAIIPKESGNSSTVFVESDKKLKIDAEKAISIAEEVRGEFEEYFNLKFLPYIGYKDDRLDLLTKEEFAEMDYIKTPISGEERICWKLHYRTEDEKINYIDIYVDAITGQIIGGIKSNNKLLDK